MESINISLNKVQQYHEVKEGVVYRHHNIIYKYDPHSKETMDAYSKLTSSKFAKNLAMPTSYLYYKDLYIGYTMKYYRFLFTYQKAINLKLIKDSISYFHYLFEIIEYLNSHNLSYWDFHNENIKSLSNGEPFLLDLSGTTINPSTEDYHNQCEYLSQFVLDSYLNESRTTNKYITLLEDKHILSDKVINYLYSTINLASTDLTLPYDLLSEINNQEVQHEIKKLTK